jgi:hypothetical protein
LNNLEEEHGQRVAVWSGKPQVQLQVRHRGDQVLITSVPLAFWEGRDSVPQANKNARSKPFKFYHHLWTLRTDRNCGKEKRPSTFGHLILTVAVLEEGEKAEPPCLAPAWVVVSDVGSVTCDACS